jgi:hypothetical protein
MLQSYIHKHNIDIDITAKYELLENENKRLNMENINLKESIKFLKLSLENESSRCNELEHDLERFLYNSNNDICDNGDITMSLNDNNVNARREDEYGSEDEGSLPSPVKVTIRKSHREHANSNKAIPVESQGNNKFRLAVSQNITRDMTSSLHMDVHKHNHEDTSRYPHNNSSITASQPTFKLPKFTSGNININAYIFIIESN